MPIALTTDISRLFLITTNPDIKKGTEVMPPPVHDSKRLKKIV